ncbi:PTS sugar transporter subunit IIA [Niallia sp. 01092]|uniref:PTS sugar transporter subunit IIA n=1 Tax=unclassified Niallia TaxID=2837522 RepID=UPI003FD12543
MVAFIIATHGEFSREIIKSAEMIFGKQENIAYVTFSPGEGPEDLQKKYHQALQELDSSKGTLFMVDLFGGSPYNAAALIAADKEDMDVIAGVNLPMLIEGLDKRQRNNLHDLIQAVSQTAADGVKSLKQSLAYSDASGEDDLL